MRAIVAIATFVSCLVAFTGCGDMFDDRCTRRPSAEGCLMQPAPQDLRRSSAAPQDLRRSSAAETLEDLQRP